jgi:hypothetical protein
MLTADKIVKHAAYPTQAAYDHTPNVPSLFSSDYAEAQEKPPGNRTGFGSLDLVTLACGLDLRDWERAMKCST